MKIDTPLPTGYNSLAFDPTGATVAAGFHGGDASGPAVEQFDVATGRSLGTFDAPAASYDEVSYDPSGRWLGAVQDTDDASNIVLWDLHGGGTPITVGPGLDFRFIPGTSSLVVVARDTPELVVYDLQPDGTFAEARRLPRPDVSYNEMAVSSTGLVAVDSLSGRRVDVLDLADGSTKVTLNLPSPGVLQFSADGRQLAVGGGDNLIRTYDTEHYAVQLVLAGSEDQPIGVAFSPDSRSLVSAAPGQLRTWDLRPQGPAALGNFHVDSGFVGSFAVAADESTAVIDTYRAGSGAIQRVDTDGASTMVADHLQQDNGTNASISQDLSTVAGIDRNWLSHVVDVGSTKATPLGRCEAVVSLDGTGTTALVDGQGLCTSTSFGASPLPGPAVDNRVIDTATDATVLDLGTTAIDGGAFGPPLTDGRPGIVVLIDGDDPGHPCPRSAHRRRPRLVRPRQRCRAEGRRHRRRQACRPHHQPRRADRARPRQAGHRRGPARRDRLVGEGAQRQRPGARRVRQRHDRHGLVGRQHPRLGLQRAPRRRRADQARRSAERVVRPRHGHALLRGRRRRRAPVPPRPDAVDAAGPLARPPLAHSRRMQPLLPRRTLPNLPLKTAADVERSLSALPDDLLRSVPRTATRSRRSS